MSQSTFNYKWDELKLFLPPGWRAKAPETNAIKRKRGFRSTPILLRTMLIYLIDGCSLRETVIKAKLGGLCDVTPKALSKRIKQSGQWFNWMSNELLRRRGKFNEPPSWLSKFNIKCVDASVVSETGSTGTDWRLHYSMSLFDLKADQYYLTNPSKGETFFNFKINENELWLGDRAYCHFKQLEYVVSMGAHFLVRYKIGGLSLFKEGKNFDVLDFVKDLKPGQIKSAQVEGRSSNSNKKLDLRICAIAKSEESANKSIKEYKAHARKKGKRYSEKTLEMQKYTIVLTSLPEIRSTEDVLNLYRARWQVELAFKRMKSLIGLGQLPKKDPESCLAWLEGKMFVFFLVQSIIDEMNFFSPWGYPTSGIRPRKYMERNIINI